ncbi:MAG: TonB-dependent receptor [Proteobacteria bacterium]|nr:TonB-dependent receptor [Pseudomonadota bacterium]
MLKGKDDDRNPRTRERAAPGTALALCLVARRPLRALPTAAALALGLCLPSAAFGQAADPADSADPADKAPGTITIVGKRPVANAARPRPSTTVLDAAELRERGAGSFEDLLATVPGVQPNPGEPGQSLPTLRGIGTATSSELLGTQQATTGLYVDEVPLTSPFGFLGTPDLTGFGLERLEVMRGPQGALYGAASLGGAIHYVLGRPQRGRQRSGVQFGATLPSTGGLGASAQAWVDVPLDDTAAALRIEGFQRRVPGDVDNLGTGRRNANALRRQGLRAAARWWVDGGTVVDASVLHQRQRLDDTQAVSPDPNRLSIDTPTASSRNDRFSLARLQVETPLAERQVLTSITAWVDQQAEPRTDLTRSSGALGNAYGPLLGLGALPLLPQVQSITRRPTRGRALSQELRLAADDPQGLRYVAGLFLQTTRFDTDSVSIAPGGQALWGPAGFLLPDDRLGSLTVHARTQEQALFGELQLPGPGRSTLSLGGRAFRTALAYDATLRYLGQDTTGAPRTQERGFTPRLGLELPLTPEPGGATLQASVTGGYRFGGANFNPPVLTPYRSDRLVNHELGLRSNAGDAWRWSLTAFWIDWRDAQVSSLLAGAVPLIGVANVGRARSRGVEAQWQWRPAQALPGFELSGALAGTDARTRVPLITDAGVPVAAGARLPGTPRWQTQLRLSQAFVAVDGWQGRATLSHSWVGARVFDIEGSAGAPGYQRLDARWAFSRGPWETALQIDNLGDQRGVTGAVVVNRPGVAAFTDWILIPPRRLGLTTAYAF